MEEECLIEKTSFDYGENSVFVNGNSNQMLKGLGIKTRKALNKPLGTIDFLGHNNDNNVLLYVSLKLPFLLKNLVNVSIKKSFTLDIGLDKMTVILKKISVGTSVGAVHAVLSEFGLIKSIKMQLDMRDYHRALLYILSIDFIGSVSRKTCTIDYYPIIYAQAKCAVVCFNSAKLLDAIIDTTLVLKSTHLHWSHLVLAKYAKCENSSYMLLNCTTSKKLLFSNPLYKVFSNINKSRLAAIYIKYSASIACPVSLVISFGSGSSLEMKPAPLTIDSIKARFTILEHSLANLTEQIGKLAKRLNSLGLAIFQPSSGYNIVMRKSLDKVTSNKTVEILGLSTSLEAVKFETMLEGLSALVLNLSVHLDGLVLAGGIISLPTSQ
ncbi:hypothetical protein G9A89_003833 [Geosiphon pyriformis]|nr:hypothetical protein G9A89_003833 [Geosiphon pyriformis]